MIRAEMCSRSIRGGRLVIGVLGPLALFGMLAPGGPMGRALAFQESGERRSVLGTGSSGERVKAEPSNTAIPAKPARPAPAAEKAKLTPQEARELMQAFRQLQAAVKADQRTETGAVDVAVKRPARTVS